MPDQEDPKSKKETELEELNLRVRRQPPVNADDEDGPASHRGKNGGYFEGASSILDTGREAETDEAMEEEPPANSTLPPAVEKAEVSDPAEAAKSRSAPSAKKARVSGLEDALRAAQGQFQDQNFEECIKILNEILMVDPGNSEAYCLLNEAQSGWEAEKQQKEWLLHLQSIRREAFSLWERKQYEECLPKFKVLNQADPDNKDYKRLLALCAEEIQKKNEIAAAPSPSAPGSFKVPVYPDEIGKSGFHQASSPTPISRIPSQPRPSQPPANDVFGQDFLFDNSQFPSPPPPKAANGREHKPDSKVDLSAPPTPPIRLRRDESTGPNWKNIGIGVAAGLLFLLILGTVFWAVFKPDDNVSSLKLQTEPDGAIVKIKDLITAQTPLYLGSITPGHYEVTFEKAGYKTQSLEIEVHPGEQETRSVTLEKLAEATPDHAKSLMAEGQLMEAARIVAAILAQNPGQGDALKLKDEIYTRWVIQANRAMAANRWEEARYAWENLLRVFPEDGEAQQQLRIVRSRQKKQVETGKKTGDPQQARIQAARDQLSAALNAGNFFPPATGNALDSLRQLELLAPGDPLVKEASEKIQGTLLAQASRKIQSRSWDEARNLLRQFQANFPESSEFRTVRDSLRSEETKLQEQKNTFIQRTEAAYSSARYITPANDNVVALASRVLSLDPQNSRMMALKRDSLIKATAQARELVKRWKYEEAHTLFQALLNLSSSESNFPLDIPQLKGEAEKTEFRSFSVIHDHGIVGSCSGRLRLNGYVITYVPTGDSKDGFIERIAEIQQIEPGDKLKIRIADRQYRFQANSAESKEDNRQKIQQIYQELRRLAPNAR